ncbi:MAG TPA: hypothetical protein VGH19_17775 [Verrucomicrobiae bacterium]
MLMISLTCIVIVVISFALVTAYMFGVHRFISDSEKEGGNNDSGHSHH